MAFSLEKQQGRVVVMHVCSPVKPGEGTHYIEMMVRVLAPLNGQSILFTHVDVGEYAKPIADAYEKVLRSNNGKFLRSAIYVQGAATGAITVYNAVKAQDNASRRVFHHAAEGIAWLQEVSTPAEREALSDYLNKISG